MPYQLTPAQLELQAARRAAKLAAKASSSSAPKLSTQELERRKFLKRSWIEVGQSTAKRRAKIVTWNILAQTLVRRELFPGSDCLRWTDRKPMLQAEFEHHSTADIICLQECDRLDDFLPSLPGHSHIYTSGPGKKHGLVVLFRSSRFRARAQKTVFLDEETLSSSERPTDGLANGTTVSSNSSQGRRRGGSRITKNVGLIAALEETADPTGGVVIATTHLFWHPKFSYERIRQLIVLLRAVREFKKEHDCDSWPTILAGDLNTTPCEATYQLITGLKQELPRELQQEFEASRFVHHSIEKSLAAMKPTSPSTSTHTEAVGPAQPVEQDQAGGKVADDDDDEEERPDTDERSVAGTRDPVPSDGLLTLPHLVAALQELCPDGLKSAYDSSDWTQGTAETFASRGGFERHFEQCPEALKGQNEPGYTCYTPLFKLTLDYLLLFPRDDVTVTGLLQPAQASELTEGLPRKGISASDHLAVGCEIAW